MNKRKNMWKFRAVLLAAGVGLVLGGCSGKKKDPVAQIREAGVLKAAIVNTDSRFTSLDGEAPVGVEPELTEAIAEALGVPVEYNIMSRNEALQAVSEGQADLAVGCIHSSKELAEEYRLSASYGKSSFCVITGSGDYVMTIGALENSQVGADKNLDSETKEQLNQVSGLILQETDLKTAAEAIRNGKLRAYICYEEQAKMLTADSEIQIQNLMNLDAEEFSIVTRKDSQNLASGIDTIVRQFLEKE